MPVLWLQHPLAGRSKDHVISTKLGGDSRQTVFACRDCSSRLGSEVEGPFLNHEFISAVLDYLPTGNKAPVSFDAWVPGVPEPIPAVFSPRKGYAIPKGIVIQEIPVSEEGDPPEFYVTGQNEGARDAAIRQLEAEHHRTFKQVPAPYRGPVVSSVRVQSPPLEISERFIARLALGAAAIKLGSEHVASSPTFDPLRSFVDTGHPPDGVNTEVGYQPALDGVVSIRGTFSDAEITVGVRVLGRVFGQVTLTRSDSDRLFKPPFELVSAVAVSPDYHGSKDLTPKQSGGDPPNPS